MATPNTVTVNLSITFSDSVATDINTTWTNLSSGSPGTLAAPMAAADATLTLTPGAPSGLSFAGNQLAVGATIRVDQEPMTVTAISGQTLTVQRAVSPLLPIPVAHLSGATVYLQTYATPWAMIADQALRPWAQQIVAQLGPNSATFGAQATGGISAA